MKSLAPFLAAAGLVPALLLSNGCGTPASSPSATSTSVSATAPGSTGIPPAAATSDQPVDAASARALFLKVHNDARAAVGVPPLEWSDSLATYAQQWANQLIARGGTLVHRPDNPHGENLAGGQYGSPSPKLAAELWLAEKKLYRDGPTGTQEGVGHYTAMVWRETTHVGYAMAKGPNGIWIVVANYSPAGNVIGQHPYRR